jgi:multicomponent Na+:H+ antiporter subunit D
MSRLLPLAVAIPLALGAATIPARRLAVRRTLCLGGGVALTGIGAVLGWATYDGTVVVSQVGGWPAPFAIPFAADAFTALMLTVSGLMVVTCTAFAIARRDDEHPMFHALALVLTAGVAGAYLTADLFNLYVWVEVMLIASYVLLTLEASPRRLRAGVVYVTANLMASVLLLAGVALIYGVTGTVNLAELAGAAATPGATAVAGVMVLGALGVKASLVPVHGWLPRAYPAAPPAVTALFSGLLTKVGVYAIYRVYSVVFGGAPGLRTPLLVVAALTMVLGVLGAVGRNTMRDILSFHMVSQIGYLLLGVGVFGPAGLAAGVFFMVQYIVVKTSLFLSAGAVEALEGTEDLDRLGGLARSRPLLAGAFAAAALSLAGFPPLSGFVAKLALVRAAFDGGHGWAAGVAVVVSFLTLLSMVKIWNGVFWGKQLDPVADRPPAPSRGRMRAILAPAAITALLTVAIGLGAQGLWVMAERAGRMLADPSAFVRAVVP